VISAVIPGLCPLPISAIVKLYTTMAGSLLVQFVFGSRYANSQFRSFPGSVRCLRKDPRQRQRDAGDCRLIFEDSLEALSVEKPEAARISNITDGRFRITDELCCSLDRGGFDGLLPGWEMQYADNNRDSGGRR